MKRKPKARRKLARQPKTYEEALSEAVQEYQRIQTKSLVRKLVGPADALML